MGFPGGADVRICLPEIQQTWVQPLGQGDPGIGNGNSLSIFVWNTEEPGDSLVHGLQKSDLST